MDIGRSVGILVVIIGLITLVNSLSLVSEILAVNRNGYEISYIYHVILAVIGLLSVITGIVMFLYRKRDVKRVKIVDKMLLND